MLLHEPQPQGWLLTTRSSIHIKFHSTIKAKHGSIVVNDISSFKESDSTNITHVFTTLPWRVEPKGSCLPCLLMSSCLRCTWPARSTIHKKITRITFCTIPGQRSFTTVSIVWRESWPWFMSSIIVDSLSWCHRVAQSMVPPSSWLREGVIPEPNRKPCTCSPSV